MNVLFLSLSSLRFGKGHGIYQDLIEELRENGHRVYAVSPRERREHLPTELVETNGIQVLYVKCGNIQKCNFIEKGISNITIEHHYYNAIKKYFKDITFDLILYPTPPIFLIKPIRFIKKRDKARSYLMLKDIFPQNAMDLGIMTDRGPMGLMYKMFRSKEKKLYAVSDKIGCMSPANVQYLLKQNPQIPPEKVGLCVNSFGLDKAEKAIPTKEEMREKYHLPQDKLLFVYGGNLGKPQGIDHLLSCIKAMQDREDVHFLVVGSGMEFHKVEAFRGETDNLTVMRSLPAEEFDEMLFGCDAGMIFLDHRFTIPNFPSRILSYMQAGLPVLSCTDANTDVGVIAENNGFGWSCCSEDVSSFCKTLEKAAADLHCKETRKAMGENSKRYLRQNYSVKETYNQIFSQLGV